MESHTAEAAKLLDGSATPRDPDPEEDEESCSSHSEASHGGQKKAFGVTAALCATALLLGCCAIAKVGLQRASPAAGAGVPDLVQGYATGGGGHGPFQCTGSAAALPPGRGDGTTWRCSAGACIMQAHRCDGSPNCLDRSDETGCPETSSGSSSGTFGGGSSSSSSSTGGGGWAPAPSPQPFPQPLPEMPAVAPAPAPQPQPQPLAPAPPGSSSSNSISYPLASSYQPPAPPEPAPGGYGCVQKAGYTYSEVWRAQGTTFFDDFNYLLNDANYGAVQYLDQQQAMQKQVTVAYETHALIRAGPKMGNLKRASAKLETKKKWQYFLVAAKFNHLPYGCGLWPAFWTHSPDAAWPDGGELDILEYTNEIATRSSLHTGLNNKCKLDPNLFHKQGCPEYIDAEFNFTGDYQCVTHYPDMIGCAPNRLPLQTGEQLTAQPVIVAAEWTPQFIKIFSFPASETPVDLTSGQPQPDTWDRYIMSYFPMAESEQNNPGSCPNPESVMMAQRLVLSLGFCGDWASKVWLNSTCANTMGPKIPSECVCVDPHNPMGEIPAGPRDCCTKFIYDEYGEYGTEDYLAKHGYFNVSWIKVFQQSAR